MDLSRMYGLMTVVGPILLAAAIAWAMLRNRTSRRQAARTEQATRENYERQDRQDKARDHDGVA